MKKCHVVSAPAGGPAATSKRSTLHGWDSVPWWALLNMRESRQGIAAGRRTKLRAVSRRAEAKACAAASMARRRLSSICGAGACSQSRGNERCVVVPARSCGSHSGASSAAPRAAPFAREPSADRSCAYDQHEEHLDWSSVSADVAGWKRGRTRIRAEAFAAVAAGGCP